MIRRSEYFIYIFIIVFAKLAFADSKSVSAAYFPIYQKEYYKAGNFPFAKIDLIYIAFVHVGLKNDKDVFLYFDNESAESRIIDLVSVVRHQNPAAKILLSLGWGRNDWGNIRIDHYNGKKFPKLIANFISNYNLDGLDIDDELICPQPLEESRWCSTGIISYAEFSSIISAIHSNLKGKLLTISPIKYDGYVSNNNFDYYNIQIYGGAKLKDFMLSGLQKSKILYGYNTANSCKYVYESGVGGFFNWNLYNDMLLCNFSFTNSVYESLHFTKRISP